jgi:MFS family permease
MTALGAVRLMVGLGLGAVLPVAVSFTADHFVPEQRERVTVAVTLGLATGATLGGFFGGRLLATLESAGVFWFAGALTLVVLTAMACLLPAEAAAAQAMEVRKSASVSRLFDAGVRLNTGLLRAYAFLIFAASYTLISWSPTLLTSYGFSRTEAPLGLAYVSLGGIICGLVLIPVAARIGIMWALILMPGLGVVSMVIAAPQPGGTARRAGPGAVRSGVAAPRRRRNAPFAACRAWWRQVGRGLRGAPESLHRRRRAVGRPAEPDPPSRLAARCPCRGRPVGARRPGRHARGPGRARRRRCGRGNEGPS